LAYAAGALESGACGLPAVVGGLPGVGGVGALVEVGVEGGVVEL
jgi:hypothetical protein